MLKGNNWVLVEENNGPEKQPVDNLQMVILIFFFRIKGCEKSVMRRRVFV